MTKPLVEVRDLEIAYPDGRLALENVSFAVERGESVALLGANGAGKSTLLLSLIGVLRGEGEIVIAGLTLCDSTLSEIRRKTQLAFQDPNDQLFMPTVGDDVAFGPLNFGVPAGEIKALVDRSLSTVGLPDFHDRNHHHLSFGERKRAALATTLACNPELLLLDEPSAGLDPRGKRQLVDLLNSLRATKIIATHDLALAEAACGRAILLHEGMIAAVGAAGALLSDHELLFNCGLS